MNLHCRRCRCCECNHCPTCGQELTRHEYISLRDALDHLHAGKHVALLTSKRPMWIRYNAALGKYENETAVPGHWMTRNRLDTVARYVVETESFKPVVRTEYVPQEAQVLDPADFEISIKPRRVER